MWIVPALRCFMVSAVEMAVNPKKRVFLALVLFSAIMTAVLLFFAWKVTYLGFEAISQFLPAAFEGGLSDPGSGRQ